MPSPSTTNVMTISIQNLPNGPFLTLTPPFLNILKGSGGGRFTEIVLRYGGTDGQVQEQRTAINAIRSRLDPSGALKLSSDGRLSITLTGDGDIFANQNSATFDLAVGEKKSLRLKTSLGIQPGGSFEHDPPEGRAKLIDLEIKFKDVNHPSLRLREDSGDHVSWHVEC